jgi:transposase
MLRMIDRKVIQELCTAGVAGPAIAQQVGCSLRSVRRVAAEAPVTDADDATARTRCGVGRPGVARTLGPLITTWVDAEPTLPPGDIARRLRERGTPLGLSTVYRLVARARRTLPQALLVRFEGMAGEFAQFDFGHVDARLLDGTRRRVHFAAYRLKYSRWVFVVVVPNERSEALVRSVLAAFAASGGVPLQVVCDNPKTIVLRREGDRPVWHPTMAQIAIDYGFSITLCTPRAPQQKGSVENLVGFVKRAFFRARRFADLTHDLPQQLAAWCVEMNTVRPSRATGVPPLARLEAERARLRPLAIAPDDYGLHVPVTVGPTAMVLHQGIRYAMPAGACGLPATLRLYPTRVTITTAGGRHSVTHPRTPLVGTISYQSGQRAQQLAAVYGQRKRLYFMRERLVELGPIGEAFLTALVHQRPHTWASDVVRCFTLLETLGDAAMRTVLDTAVRQRLIGGEYVERLAAQAHISEAVA